LERVEEHSAWNGVERRLSEAVHTQQAKRWENVFQNLTEGIAVCDSDGRIVQLNRSFATLLKRAEYKPLVGMDIQALVSEQVDEASIAKICKITTSHASQAIEI